MDRLVYSEQYFNGDVRQPGSAKCPTNRHKRTFLPDVSDDRKSVAIPAAKLNGKTLGQNFIDYLSFGQPKLMIEINDSCKTASCKAGDAETRKTESTRLTTVNWSEILRT